jgi:hypothetical protein
MSASVEKRVIEVAVAPVTISIAGRVDDRGFQACRVIGRALQLENTHVTVNVLPMWETDWEEFVRNTALVRIVSIDVYMHIRVCHATAAVL